MNIIPENTQPSGYPFKMTAYDHRTHEGFIYSARRNQAELTKLINRHFEHTSRILVIRIDLSYRQEVAHTLSIETVQLHRKQLLEDRRSHPKVFEGLLGYAWCLEQGEFGGGYHYHLLALYDGADHQQDIGRALAISDLWSIITNGFGKCYISNFDKEDLSERGDLGIGMIHRDDKELRINLIEKVATYITKRSTVFTVRSGSTISGEFRTFGKSRMPKPLDPNVPRRGRPPAPSDLVW